MVVNPITAQSVDQDSLFDFTMPTDAFTDPDGDPLTFSARLADGSDLPAWLTFDAASKTFSGTPGNAAVGNLNVQITASDPSGASASQSFTLTVVNINDAPEVGTLLSGQQGRVGQEF
ncbi:MAG: putative Ig domain-containing protein, partial [Burkholderiaceae bacterium]|nr:putative Ig domain-containing protein [Burkholderiaceae bacterium]